MQAPLQAGTPFYLSEDTSWRRGGADVPQRDSPLPVQTLGSEGRTARWVQGAALTASDPAPWARENLHFPSPALGLCQIAGQQATLHCTSTGEVGEGDSLCS